MLKGVGVSPWDAWACVRINTPAITGTTSGNSFMSTTRLMCLVLITMHSLTHWQSVMVHAAFFSSTVVNLAGLANIVLFYQN